MARTTRPFVYRNRHLKEMTYANGDTMKATYNSLGQMIGEKWYNVRLKFPYQKDGYTIEDLKRDE